LDESPREILDNLEVIPGDVRDLSGMKAAMSGCDAVFHLAALIAIPYSYNSPSSYVDTNITGTLNILQAARELNVKRIIHTSTSEVYGTAKYVPIDEMHPLQGQSPYSATKIAADQIALSFYASFELPVLVVRPFNTYGPRQSARAVIPTIITQILGGSRNLKLGSTSTTRDFSYVSDTVSGFIAALESDSGIGQVFNLGSGFEISIRETVELIQELMGTYIEMEVDKERIRPINSEVERLWSENSKALNTFDWIPEYAGVSGLREGLIRTIEWFKLESNMKKYKTGVYNL
jgi:dTDP-glucose 4,6-dehydratase